MRQCRGPSLSGTGEVALVCFRVAGRAMELAVALGSMLNSPFYYQDGRWNTGTDNIELRGRRRHWDGSSRETMTDQYSASRISNTNRPTDPGGGNSTASNKSE